MRLRERPAIDLAVLGVTAIIGGMLLLTALAVLLIELIHPESDTESLIRVETEILAVLVGALVGFLGGRSVGRDEARNGGTPSGP